MRKKQLRYNQEDVSHYLQNSMLKLKAADANATNIKALSLRGGGQKGLIYSGMLQALEETNFPDSKTNVLSAIKHLTGSSAGAITASFIAAGVTSIELKEITSVPFSMFKNALIRSDRTTFKNFLNVIYLYKLHEKDPGNKKTIPIMSVLKNKGLSENFFNKKNLQRLVNLIKNNPDYFERLPQVTFRDLQRLSDKTLDVTVTDTKQHITQVFNEKTPDKNLADIVTLSASHPLLFEQQEGFTDGGVTDNMPLIPLIHRGIPLTDIITVGLAPGRQPKEYLKLRDKKQSHLAASMQQKIIGATVTKSLENQSITKGITAGIGNHIELLSGEITTTSMHVEEQLINKANHGSFTATQQFLEQRFSRHYQRSKLLRNLANNSKGLKAIILASEEFKAFLDNTSTLSPKVRLNKQNEAKEKITKTLQSITSNILEQELEDEDALFYDSDSDSEKKESEQDRRQDNFHYSDNDDNYYNMYQNLENSTPPANSFPSSPDSLSNRKSNRDDDDYNMYQNLENSTPPANSFPSSPDSLSSRNSNRDDDYFNIYQNSQALRSRELEPPQPIETIQEQLLTRPQRISNIEQEQNDMLANIFDIVNNLTNLEEVISKEEVLKTTQELTEVYQTTDISRPIRG